jgi:hypothetical protein
MGFSLDAARDARHVATLVLVTRRHADTEGILLNAHERFQACMRFQPVDHPPLLEWGPWGVTLERWQRETGQDEDHVMAWRQACDLAEMACADFSLRPPFEEEVVAEDETTRTIRDRMGLVYRQFKQDAETSMPEFVEFPVKSRADWEAIKRRLDPTDPDRYPADWTRRLQRWRSEGRIIHLYGLVANYFGGPSLFGFCRMLLGDEQVLYTLHDDPALIEDMMEFQTEFSLALLRRALHDVPVTYAQLWEDMCYSAGPLISPAMFTRLMVPRYRRITDAMRAAGVDIIFVDSDGDVAQLLPLWLESGINGVFPMEQAAGNDIGAYRRRYGKDLLMTGGIDKRALAWGREAIDRELEAKVPVALEGGYIPTIDHSIPPDVSYDNFMYYWEKKLRMLGV